MCCTRVRLGRNIIGDAALLHCLMRLFARSAAGIAFLALGHDIGTLGSAGMIALGVIRL